MISPRASSRLRWVAVAAVYIAITLAYGRRLLPVIGSALPNDTGDPGLNTWILWWNAHALPLTERWWNGPIFYPAPGAMALSETFLHLWLLSTPLQWAGASAVLTYNLMYLLSFPAAALAAHLLAWRLTGRHAAGFVAGLAYGFAPYRAAQMPHLQTLWSCWMPLALYFLHGAVRAGSPGIALIGFAVCWLFNGLSTGYYLFFFSVLVGLWLIWHARSVRAWVTIAAAALVGSLPLAPLLLGYRHYQSQLGLARTTQEIEFFSADLSAIWATTPYVWPHQWTLQPGPEGELYPGATIIALVIVGGLIVWRRMRPDRRYRAQPWLLAAAAVLAVLTWHAWTTGGWAFQIAGMNVSLTRPAKAMFLTLCVSTLALGWNPRIVDAWRRRSALLFYAIASVVMLLFALGPRGHFLKATFLYEAPYYWLMRLPGGSAFRVPARFGMLVALCLATAAAIALGKILTVWGAGKQGSGEAWEQGSRDAGEQGNQAVLPRFPASPLARLSTLLICAAILLEGFVFRMEIAKVPPSVDFAGLNRGAVVLELPMTDEYSDTAAMLRATRTGHTLVNGFSGYLPPHYTLLKEGLAAYDASVLRALQQYGPLLVFVHDGGGEKYTELLESLPDAHRVLAGAAGALYRLPARVVEALPAAGPLPIASIRASSGAAQTGAMIDGDPATRWQTPMHQASGDRVTLTFDRPVMISRLEMDLGRFKDDAPRQLRITMGDPGAPPVTVWEGRTAGLAMIATLTDRLRMPLVFNFSRHVTGRELVLTVLDGHMDFAWSIAELRVFGQ